MAPAQPSGAPAPRDGRILAASARGCESRDFSLYVHIPFCSGRCGYCDFNTYATEDFGDGIGLGTYADDAIAEILFAARTLEASGVARRPLHTVFFGGGTPTFLSDDQLERVCDMIRKYFQLIPNGEYSIEIDPRKVSRETVLKLGKLGFNRMSVGIQDFDPKVQEAVNRIQSYEETKEVIDAAREAGFKSVSVDLIYGLQHQNTESIKTTIDTVLSLDPARLALYHYAHLPHIFKPQRRIDTNVVPGIEEKLDMLQYCVQTLTERGYVFIGMDHFAKPDDELSIALKEGFLQRNFQGYSTYADCDLVAIGVSSIGKIGSTYSQNERDIDAYYAALDAGHLPIMRGYQLNQDDMLRRNIIQDVMCRFSLDYQIYESVFGIPFSRYFAAELEDMKQLETLGLVRLKPHSLTVTPKGRFLIRNIAMVFDYHLRHKETKAKYSQTV